MAELATETRSPDLHFVAREATVGLAGRRAPLTRLRVPGELWATWIRPPSRRWTWRGSVLLMVLLVQPYLLVPLMDAPRSQALGSAGLMSLLFLNVALFGSAVILKYEWRLSQHPSTGWLAMALAFTSVQNIPFALLGVSGSSLGGYGYVLGVTQFSMSLVTLSLLLLATGRVRIPTRIPLPIGIVLGAGAAVLRLALAHAGLDPTMRLTPFWSEILTFGAVLVSIAAVILILRWRTLPTWVRGRLALATVLLMLAVTVHVGTGGPTPSAISVVTGCFGAVLVCSTAIALLRHTLSAHSRQLVAASHRAATAEANVRHGREKMHELNATIAGVAHASRLLVHMGGPLGPRRAQLEHLLDSEMARLQRMLSERGEEEVAPIVVDDVLQPLIQGQRTLGHRVSYEPSGQTALGRSDDLAEVVHILLVNVARHAPGSLARISVTGRDGELEIRVSDDGPGVDPDLVPVLFEWGTRRPGSPGEGIGLQLARRLMIEQAGDLRLDTHARASGATFVVTIPAAGLDPE